MALQSLNDDFDFDDKLDPDKIHNIVSNMPSKKDADEAIKQMFEKLKGYKHYNGK